MAKIDRLHDDVCIKPSICYVHDMPSFTFAPADVFISAKVGLCRRP